MKKTEILTAVGWKDRNNLKPADVVLTLNLETSLLEYNSIDETMDYTYTGNVYSIQSKGFDFRVTEKHVMIDIKRNRKNIQYNKFPAINISSINRRIFIRSGILKDVPNIPISIGMLQLLVWITADGNICNTNLVRIGLKKKRKINRIRNLLCKLSIQFREIPQKDSSISFNFTIPQQLLDYRFKPLDVSIRNASTIQTRIILEEYVATDGKKYGKTYVIYTSKKVEADILQEACLKNGFTATITERSQRKKDNINRKTRYEIFVTDRKYSTVSNLKNRTKVEKVYNEHFWCVRVRNKTIVVRRNGKPMVVGNSHGKLFQGEMNYMLGKSWDVGVDSIYMTYGEYRPVSWDEVVEYMKHRPDNFNLVERLRKETP